MDNKMVIYMVGTRCRAELEQKFNRWYDEVHIPLLLKFPEMTGVRRWKKISSDEKYPEYLVMYEFEDRDAWERYTTSPERKAAMEEMKETWKDEMFEIVWQVQYEITKTWQK